MAPKTTITIELRPEQEYHTETGNNVFDDAQNTIHSNTPKHFAPTSGIHRAANYTDDGDPISYLVVHLRANDQDRIEQLLTTLTDSATRAAVITWNTVGQHADARVYSINDTDFGLTKEYHETEPQNGEYVASKIHIDHNIPAATTPNVLQSHSVFSEDPPETTTPADP